MLSWMRWLTSWFWNIVNSGGTGGGFLRWFADNWVSLTVFLIVAGVIVDWLVWMIRWRPYWLWLRKRQYIYEEVSVPSKKKRSRPARPAAGEDFDDPFSEDDSDPYAHPAPADDMAEWDSAYDPYARPEPEETPKKIELKRSRPVLGERMKHSNVDDGQ